MSEVGANSATDLLNKAGIDLWRESMSQLRHLSLEFWRTGNFYLALNFTLALAMIGLVRFHRFDAGSALLLVLLCVVGLVLTLTGTAILRRQRIYYLQMLAKKSLLEQDLGLYRSQFADSKADFALPWRLGAEAISEIRQDFDGWVNKSIKAEGTIARYQFGLMYFFVGSFALVLCLALLQLTT